MSDFTKRLEDLKKKQSEQILEKNKLEALISVKKETLKELKTELEEKGLDYETIEELESEIKEREEYLENKITTLEQAVISNNNLIQDVQPELVVEEKSKGLELNFDM